MRGFRACSVSPQAKGSAKGGAEHQRFLREFEGFGSRASPSQEKPRRRGRERGLPQRKALRFDKLPGTIGSRDGFVILLSYLTYGIHEREQTLPEYGSKLSWHQ